MTAPPMTNTKALLERARKLCEPPTWYRLGKETGIAHGTITRCIRHGRTLDDKNAWKLAKFLQLDAKDVVAYMQEDRAKANNDTESAAFWSAQLPRLLPSIAIAVATLWLWAPPLIGGATIDSEGHHANATNSTAYTLYVL